MFHIQKASIKEAKLSKPIYKEAFPLIERKPFYSVLKTMRQGKAEFILAKEDDKTVGFGICVTLNDIVYLDYLAMDESCRGKGYGTLFLQELFKYYDGKRLTLIMERVDEPCDNKEQRVKRKAFYLNNGMQESHLFVNASSGHYEILVHGGTISGEEFISVMNFSLGKLYAAWAKYHIVD